MTAPPTLPRPLLPVLMLATFVVGVDFFIASPLLASLARGFAVPVPAAAAVIPTFALPYGLGALLFAPLAGRLGRRPLLLTALLCFSLATLLTAAAPSFPVLLLSRVLAGTAAAALTPNLYALVSDLAPEGDRPRLLGLLLSGIMSGLVVGVPLGTALAEAVGWRGVFWALGACGLLLLVAFAAVVPARPGTAGNVPFLETVARAVRLPGARPALLTSALLFGAPNAAFSLFGPFLMRRYGLDISDVGWVIAVYGVCSVAGNFTTQLVLRSLGGLPRTIGVGALGIAALLLVIGLGRWPLGVLVVLVVAWGYLNGFAIPAQQALVAQVGGGARGTLLSLASSAMYLGLSALSALEAALLHLVGDAAPAVLSAACLLAVPLLLGQVGRRTAGEARTAERLG